jgi:hypothetical protein
VGAVDTSTPQATLVGVGAGALDLVKKVLTACRPAVVRVFGLLSLEPLPELAAFDASRELEQELRERPLRTCRAPAP